MIYRHSFAGGKGTERNLYLHYNDNEATAPDQQRIAKFSWPVANSAPTFLYIKDFTYISNLITTAYPAVVLGSYEVSGIQDESGYPWEEYFIYFFLVGSKDDNSIYLGYWDAVDPDNVASYIAEIDTTTSTWSYTRRISGDYDEQWRIRLMDTKGSKTFIHTLDVNPPTCNIKSDDFTGSNDDPVNLDKWSVISGAPTIQNNKIELEKLGSGTADVIRSAHYGDYSLSEIIVDYELMDYSAGNDWWIEMSGWYLSSYLTPPETEFPERVPWHLRYGYWDGGYKYEFGWLGFDVNDQQTEVVNMGGSANPTGKFRIEICEGSIGEETFGYGSTKMWFGETEYLRRCRAYYWNGSAWVLIKHVDLDEYFLGGSTHITLKVHNDTGNPNIRCRFDNYTVTVGKGRYFKINEYATASYNAVSEKFESLVRSKRLLSQVQSLVAGTTGIVASLYKVGYTWSIDQPADYWQVTTYDNDLVETSAGSTGVEYHMGWHANYTRNLWDKRGDFNSWDNPWWRGFSNVMIAGEPPTSLFSCGTDDFITGNNIVSIIELDTVTLKPKRISQLHLPESFGVVFDGTEIQTATAITQTEEGTRLDPSVANNCRLVSLGAKGNNIYSITRYTFIPNCACDGEWDDEAKFYCPDSPTGHTCINMMDACGPGTPTTGIYGELCPSTDYYLEKRAWNGRRIALSEDVQHIKPAYWNEGYSKPWWIVAIVVDTNGIFILLKDVTDVWLLHLDPADYSVLNRKQVKTPELTAEYDLYRREPWGLAGNGTTLYIFYIDWARSWLRTDASAILTFDVSSWDFDIMSDNIHMDYLSEIYEDGDAYYHNWPLYGGIAGDAVNGYLYTTELFWYGSPHHYLLHKRIADPAQNYEIVLTKDLSYDPEYPTLKWERNPAGNAVWPQIWCAGGDSTAIYLGGADCVDSNNYDVVLYKFDPDTLDYIGKMPYCKFLDVQIMSFW